MNQSINFQIAPQDVIAIGAGILVFFVIIFVVFVLAFKKRKEPILKLFGSNYFKFDIINKAGQCLTIQRAYPADFKIEGDIVTFVCKIGDKTGRYIVKDGYVYWKNKTPQATYREGNPLPLNINTIPDPEIPAYDEEKKTMVKVKISANELHEALVSKVVSDLNKSVFDRMDIIILLIALMMLVVGIVNVYMTYQTQSNIQALINQLNQILNHLSSSGTGTTGFIPKMASIFNTFFVGIEKYNIKPYIYIEREIYDGERWRGGRRVC